MEQTDKQPTKDALIDGYGRKLNYLRISVTDRCNFRCQYCMPTGGVRKLTHQEILSLEEITRVAKAAVGAGVEKIRLTGGEPLLRKNIEALLESLDALRPRPDLRITSNGFFLEEKLGALAKYGISTINISLDSLIPSRYGLITGLGEERGAAAYARVWRGINAALESGAFTVKLNMVVLAGENSDELLDFAALTQKYPLAVRFIEYMPVGRHTPFDRQRFMPANQILDILEKGLGKCNNLPVRPGDGPARRYQLEGAPGELGVISAVSSHFCDACNRLRLTADGRLAPCLFSNQTLDVRELLRNGAGRDELVQILSQAAAAKPKGHHQTASAHEGAGCPMSRLGG